MSGNHVYISIHIADASLLRSLLALRSGMETTLKVPGRYAVFQMGCFPAYQFIEGVRLGEAGMAGTGLERKPSSWRRGGVWSYKVCANAITF